jgi:hypothetical protein
MGSIITFRLTVLLVPQALVEVTSIVTVPLNPEFQVAAPVVPVPRIVPAPEGDNVQLNEVASVAVVVKLLNAVPWHIGLVPLIAVGVPGTGLIVICEVVAVLVPHEFVAVTLIVALPV